MSVIIECRNKTADIKHKDGDWETLLGENITINPQDQLYVKNSFIDTQLSTNDKINIEETTTLELRYGYYNILNNQYGLRKYTDLASPPDLNYSPMTLCVITEIPTPDPDNHVLVESGKITSADGINPAKATDIIFSYTDFNGDPISDLTRTVEVAVGESITANFGAIAKQGFTFSPDIATLEREFNIKLEITTTTIEGKNVAVPIVNKTEITLQAGTYDPDSLCEIINEKMTTINPITEFPFQGNSILNSVGYFQNSVYGNAGGVVQKLLFVPQDGQNLVMPRVTSEYARPPNNDLFTGASQFVLAFDENTKTFEFSYMHTPFYYQTHPAVQIFKDTSVGGLPVYEIGNQSGIFLQKLTATTTQGKSTNFWSLLGFDLTQTPNLIQKFTYIEVDDAQDPPKKLLLATTNYNFGLSVTRGLITTDTAIVKDDPLVPFADNPIISTATIDETTSIKAGISVLDNEDKFGYFIVEIGHKLKNDFYTQENNYRNFQQVVSRYFVQNSYTSGTSDGSLIYTHEGEPTLLQSFRCRILNSDKELANNIGQDNTIHLVLVRAPQPLALPPPAKKEDEKEKDEK